MSFKIKSCTDPKTGAYGVILPDSTTVLSESEVNNKIQKVKKRLSHLEQIGSKKHTRGGKKHRAKVLTNQNEIKSSLERLALLIEAKKTFTNPPKPNPTLRQILLKNAVPISDLEGYYILERSPYAAIFEQGKTLNLF